MGGTTVPAFAAAGASQGHYTQLIVRPAGHEALAIVHDARNVTAVVVGLQHARLYITATA